MCCGREKANTYRFLDCCCECSTNMILRNCSCKSNCSVNTQTGKGLGGTSAVAARRWSMGLFSCRTTESINQSIKQTIKMHGVFQKYLYFLSSGSVDGETNNLGEGSHQRPRISWQHAINTQLSQMVNKTHTERPTDDSQSKALVIPRTLQASFLSMPRFLTR